MLTLSRIVDAVWFCPDVRGNLDLPEAERFKVRLLPLTAQERRQLEAAHVSAKMTAQDDASWLQRYYAVRESVLLKCVAEVKGLFDRRLAADGTEATTPIVSAEELVRLAPDDILESVLLAIGDVSRLEAGLVKKSNLPCSTSIAPMTACGNGVVRGVTQASNQTSAVTLPQTTLSYGDPIPTSAETATVRA